MSCQLHRPSWLPRQHFCHCQLALQNRNQSTWAHEERCYATYLSYHVVISHPLEKLWRVSRRSHVHLDTVQVRRRLATQARHFLISRPLFWPIRQTPQPRVLCGLSHEDVASRFAQLNPGLCYRGHMGTNVASCPPKKTQHLRKAYRIFNSLTQTLRSVRQHGVCSIPSKHYPPVLAPPRRQRWPYCHLPLLRMPYIL